MDQEQTDIEFKARCEHFFPSVLAAVRDEGVAIREERARVEQNHIDLLHAASGKCKVCDSKLQANGLCFYDCNPLEVEPDDEPASGNYRAEEVEYYAHPD